MTDAARVRLRPYTRDDLAAFSALLGDPEVMRYVGDCVPLAPEAARAVFDKAFVLYATDPSFRIWAVDEEGAYAGHAELKRRPGRAEYELIYFCRASAGGAAWAGASSTRSSRSTRAERLPFVIATVDAENAASLRLLERRGFRSDAGLSAEFGCPALRLDLEPHPNPPGPGTREQHEHDERHLRQPRIPARLPSQGRAQQTRTRDYRLACRQEVAAEIWAKVAVKDSRLFLLGVGIVHEPVGFG